MSGHLQQSSVEDLNQALRLYRSLIIRLPIILILGFVGCFLLASLGTYLSPPYGIYILGEGLGTWGLIIVVLLILGECWFKGRQIGRALDDPLLRSSPVVGLMSGLTVIAQRADTIGMKWSGFLGPLKPVSPRR